MIMLHYIVHNCNSGIALTGSSYGGPSGDLVINNKIADYSFVTQPFSLDEHKSILRCATGLGPSYWDNNAVLGGWYFKGAQIPVGRNCYGYGFEVRGASVRNYPGVINLYLCETFNTTEEGLYSCIMMNSSMMKQTVRVGLYLSGRSESLDMYPNHFIVNHLYLSTQLFQSLTLHLHLL